MTYKSESWFRTVLGKLFTGADFKHVNIESAGTSLGIPDMFVAGHGISAWVELKNEGDLTRKDLIKIDFQPLQFRWLRDYYKKGATCILMVAHTEGVSIFVDDDIHETYLHDEFFEKNGPMNVIRIIGLVNTIKAKRKGRHHD